MNQYAKYIIFKSAIEDLFGSDAWYALKESDHIPTWRNYAEKTLKSIELAIKDTVEIYDEEWMQEIERNIQRGIEALKKQNDIDEFMATLAGTLINVSFMQIGSMPRRSGNNRKYPLRKGKWCFNGYRQVVYLQTKEQKEKLFFNNQRRAIGFEKQQDLLSEYQSSGLKVPYSEWCNANEKA